MFMSYFSPKTLNRCESKVVLMTEITNRLAFTLVLVVVVTTLLTTFTFFQVEQLAPQDDTSSGQDSGKVSINIPKEEVVQKTAAQPASVSINIGR